MKFVIYSKNNCPNCDKAKAFITQFGSNYANKFESMSITTKYIDKDTNAEEDMLSMFESIGGPPPRSVPQIFVTTDDGETRHIEFNSLIKELARLKD